jgi:hypothetical protein
VGVIKFLFADIVFIEGGAGGAALNVCSVYLSDMITGIVFATHGFRSKKEKVPW